jgi:hypothetical protein
LVAEIRLATRYTSFDVVVETFNDVSVLRCLLEVRRLSFEDVVLVQRLEDKLIRRSLIRRCRANQLLILVPLLLDQVSELLPKLLVVDHGVFSVVLYGLGIGLRGCGGH